MANATERIIFAVYDVEELHIITFILSKEGISDQVSKLNQPRCSGVYERGNLSHIT